jgi:hypothetical protein
MIKILLDDVTAAMMFDLNQTPYQIVDATANDIDIVAIETKDKELFYLEIEARLKVFFSMQHNYDHQIRNLYYNYYDDIISEVFKEHQCYTITNAIDFSTELQSKYILHYDFLFNAVKAYYSDFQFTYNTAFYYAGSDAYKIAKHDKTKTKIYVAPNRTHLQISYRQIKYRPSIVEHLRNKYLTLGYLGNHDDGGQMLAAQADYPNATIEQLNNLDNIKMFSTQMSPVHNAYYEDSFISIYGETVEVGTTIVVTEKTYNPLIKGHFIFPFSSSGFLKYLTSLGFKLPNFIDYSYDEIVDDDLRFEKYLQELDRLLSIPLTQWQNYWDDNFINIILYNQQLFFTKDYVKLDLAKYFKE